MIGGVVTAAIPLAVAFGVKVTPAEQQALLAFTAAVTALVSAYAVSRGIRKRGTPQ
jgi:hypothetical protein